MASEAQLQKPRLRNFVWTLPPLQKLHFRQLSPLHRLRFRSYYGFRSLASETSFRTLPPLQKLLRPTDFASEAQLRLRNFVSDTTPASETSLQKTISAPQTSLHKLLWLQKLSFRNLASETSFGHYPRFRNFISENYLCATDFASEATMASEA